jgi:hypothetical protein
LLKGNPVARWGRKAAGLPVYCGDGRATAGFFEAEHKYTGGIFAGFFSWKIIPVCRDVILEVREEADKMWESAKEKLLFWRRASEKELELLLQPEGVIDDPERIKAEFKSLHKKGIRPGSRLKDTLEIKPSLHSDNNHGDSYHSPVVLLEFDSGNSNGKVDQSSFCIDVPKGSLSELMEVGSELQFKYGDPRTTCYLFRSRVEEVGDRLLPHLGDKKFHIYKLPLPDKIEIRVLRRSYILDLDGELRLSADFRDRPFKATVLVHADRRLGEATLLMDRSNPERLNEYNLMDISVDALRLCSERSFKEGEEFDLTVFMPTDGTIHVKKAKVTKSNIYSKVRGKPTIFTIFSYDQSRNHSAYRKIQTYVNGYLTEKKKRNVS